MNIEEAKTVALSPIGCKPHELATALRVLADALRASQARCVRLSETNHAMFDAVMPGKAMRDDKVGQVKWAVSEFERRIAEAQAQTVQMREEAVRSVGRLLKEPALDGDPSFESGVVTTIAHAQKAIRALPAPAARTYEDVRREGVQAAFDAVHRVSALPYTDSPRSAFDAARIMREACQDAIAALLSPAPAVAPVAAPNPGPTTATVTRDYTIRSADGSVRDADGAIVKPPFDAEAALVAMRDHLFVKNAAVFPTPEADHVLFYALEAGLAAGRGAR